MTNPPSAAGHIWQLARFELSKRFKSRSGIIALIAFILVWSILLVYPIKEASNIIMQPSFKEFIASLFGPNTLNELFNWQVSEFAMLWVAAIYLFPMFSIFISADQFSSDRNRGTLRFISLRVSRSSLFFGRFIGQVFIQAILIVITLIATVILAVSREANLLLPAIYTSAIVFINLLIVVLPYTATMALISLVANSAKQASIFAIIIWIVISLMITLISTQFPAFELISYLLPGSQLSSMVNTQGFASLALAPIPLIQTLIILTVGRLVMQRSAL